MGAQKIGSVGEGVEAWSNVRSSSRRKLPGSGGGTMIEAGGSMIGHCGRVVAHPDNAGRLSSPQTIKFLAFTLEALLYCLSCLLRRLDTGPVDLEVPLHLRQTRRILTPPVDHHERGDQQAGDEQVWQEADHRPAK